MTGKDFAAGFQRGRRTIQGYREAMRRDLAGLLVIVCGAVVLEACTTSAPTPSGSPG